MKSAASGRMQIYVSLWRIDAHKGKRRYIPTVGIQDDRPAGKNGCDAAKYTLFQPAVHLSDLSWECYILSAAIPSS